jgi:WD40 repeat protein
MSAFMRTNEYPSAKREATIDYRPSLRLSCLLLMCTPLHGLAQPAEKPTNQAVSSRLDQFGDPLPADVLARYGTIRFRADGSVRDLCVSPDGKSIAIEDTLRVVLFEYGSGKVLRILPVESKGMAFSRDGRQLLVADYLGVVRKWNLSSGRELVPVEFDSPPTTRRLFFSPGSEQMAAAEFDGDILVWDVSNPHRKPGRLVGHKGNVKTIVWTSDGKRIASGGTDGTVRLWDVASLKSVRVFNNHTDQVVAVAWSPDNRRIVSMGDEQQVLARVWDATTGRELLQIPPQTGNYSVIDSVHFSHDGKFIISSDTEIHVWNAETGAHVRQVGVAVRGIYRTSKFADRHAVRLSSKSGEMVVGTQQGVVQVYEIGSGKLLTPMAGHLGEIEAIAFAQDRRRVITAGSDETIREWDVASGAQLRQLAVRHQGDFPIALSANGQWAATGGKFHCVNIWDLAAEKIACSLDGLNEPIRACCFSENGKWCAAGDETGRICVWEPGTGKKLQDLNVFTEPVQVVQFSRDGQYIAVGGDQGLLEIWRWQNARRFRFILSGEAISSIAFSPSGGELAVGGDRVRVWEIVSARQITSFAVRSSPYALSFAANGRHLFCGCNETGMASWDLATGKALPTLTGGLSGTMALAVAAKEQLLFAGNCDTTTLSCKLPNPSPLDLAAQGKPADLLNDLRSEDTKQAHRAIWSLIQIGQPAVAEIRRRIRLAVAPDESLVKRLITELDHRDFRTREEAMQQLTHIGHAAEPLLRKALDEKASTHRRRQIQRVIDSINGPVSDPEQLSAIRAITVLETIGSRECEALLKEISTGDSNALLTSEATLALGRLRSKSR